MAQSSPERVSLVPTERKSETGNTLDDIAASDAIELVGQESPTATTCPYSERPAMSRTGDRSPVLHDESPSRSPGQSPRVPPQLSRATHRNLFSAIARSLSNRRGIHTARQCGLSRSGSHQLCGAPVECPGLLFPFLCFCVPWSPVACAIRSPGSALWRGGVATQCQRGQFRPGHHPSSNRCHADSDWCERRTAGADCRWLRVRCRPLHAHDGCRFPAPPIRGLCHTPQGWPEPRRRFQSSGHTLRAAPKSREPWEGDPTRRAPLPRLVPTKDEAASVGAATQSARGGGGRRCAHAHSAAWRACAKSRQLRLVSAPDA